MNESGPHRGKIHHNLLSDVKGVMELFRCQQNLKHLQAYREVLKSKVDDGVVSHDPAHVIDLLR